MQKLNFNDVKKVIRANLNSVEVSLGLGGRKKTVGQLTETMFKHIEDALVDGEFKETISDEMVQEIRRVSNNVMSMLILENTSEAIDNFCWAYSILLTNWCNATKNQELAKIGSAISVLINYRRNTIAMIEYMKQLIRTARQFTSFNAPAFNNSKSYLDSLYNDLEQGKRPDIRNK